MKSKKCKMEMDVSIERLKYVWCDICLSEKARGGFRVSVYQEPNAIYELDFLDLCDYCIEKYNIKIIPIYKKKNNKKEKVLLDI